MVWWNVCLQMIHRPSQRYDVFLPTRPFLMLRQVVGDGFGLIIPRGQCIAAACGQVCGSGGCFSRILGKRTITNYEFWERGQGHGHHHGYHYEPCYCTAQCQGIIAETRHQQCKQKEQEGVIGGGESAPPSIQTSVVCRWC